MKFIRSAQMIVAFLALGVTASAQQVSTQPTPGAAPAVLAAGKIAVINTNVLQEQIGEFRSKIEALNRQFEPRVKEVQQLADRINSLETTIKTQGPVLGAAKVAEMTEQVETMKREYQRKAEDLQADGNRARERAFQPVQEKLGKFAQEYTAKRGIVLLIDLANAVQSNIVIWYDPRSDVTQDFINEYNKANPSPAAPQPSPQKQ